MTREEEILKEGNRIICGYFGKPDIDKLHSFQFGVRWADKHPNCHRNDEDVNEYIKIMEKARWQGWSLERIIRNTIMWADQNRPKGKED